MSQPISETTDGELNNWTVLIVDDTPDNITVAKTALIHHGAYVYGASDAEEGLEVLKAVLPTVILLDIRMPKMDGWQMFKAVRENPETADVPIIAVTAYAMENDRDELIAAGFNGYISKPIDIFLFVAEVQRVVAESKRKKMEGKVR